MASRVFRAILCGLLAFAAVSARADGGGGGGGDQAAGSPAEVQKAVDAIKAEHYDQAIGLLRSYVARIANDADALNWLGYAYRKSGRLEQAFAYYKRALVIDPQHRGAHEYIGEAYLQAGQPAMAERHLKILVGLCPAGCEQREDLDKALAEYRAAPAKAAGR